MLTVALRSSNTCLRTSLWAASMIARWNRLSACCAARPVLGNRYASNLFRRHRTCHVRSGTPRRHGRRCPAAGTSHRSGPAGRRGASAACGPPHRWTTPAIGPAHTTRRRGRAAFRSGPDRRAAPARRARSCGPAPSDAGEVTFDGQPRAGQILADRDRGDQPVGDLVDARGRVELLWQQPRRRAGAPSCAIGPSPSVVSLNVKS